MIKVKVVTTLFHHKNWKQIYTSTRWPITCLCFVELPGFNNYSHQTGIWGNTGKRSYLGHLHKPNTDNNLRYYCTMPSTTTSKRRFVSLPLFLHIMLTREGFAFRKKPLHVHYWAEEGFNSLLKLQNNESSQAASFSARNQVGKYCILSQSGVKPAFSKISCPWWGYLWSSPNFLGAQQLETFSSLVFKRYRFWGTGISLIPAHTPPYKPLFEVSWAAPSAPVWSVQDEKLH